jgi:hypothetical protein
VLYSINVFITFSLSQLGMVRHWWQVRGNESRWRWRLTMNAIGLVLTSLILATLVVLKFHDGGWITLVLTVVLIAVAFAVRRHYRGVGRQLRSLDLLRDAATSTPAPDARDFAPPAGKKEKTAIVLVNGFNGLGLHTLLGAVRLFGGFGRFVFVQVGVVDAGNFKGADELDRLRAHVTTEGERYVEYVRSRGGEAESFVAIGHEVVSEIEHVLPEIIARHPGAVFFCGQLVFERETILTRVLHNFTGFDLQRRLAVRGWPCAIVPVRISSTGGQPVTLAATLTP